MQQFSSDRSRTWHIQVLILFGCANGIALFALILLIISYCHGKLCCVPWAQQYGSAFYMAVSGCILYLIQTILAIVSCVLICTQRRGFQAVPTSYPANQNGNKPWQYAKPERQQSHNTVV
uniref:Uncharacterized protein n=1 Tax=Romanomermis culicivorax TaxID=13658 RepID=A0A915HJZ4_ROMCU